MNIDVILSEFNDYAGRSKGKLEEMLTLITEGRVPSATVRKEFDEIIDVLQQKYESICSIAQNELLEDEIPSEGSPVSVWYDAIKNSKSAMLKTQLEEIKVMLQRFTSVQSLVEKLSLALEPFQKDAEILIKKITDGQVENVSDITEEISGPELFLKAVEYDDFNTDEGIELLDTLEDKHGFPSRITRGLSSKSYFIAEEAMKKGQPNDTSVLLNEMEQTGFVEMGDVTEEIQVAGSANKTVDTAVEFTEKAQIEETEDVEECKTEPKSEFRQALERARFALDEDAFGILSSEISMSETKKISASVFTNDLRKGNEKAAKSIIQQVNNFPMLSPELLEVRFGMSPNIAESSLDFLQKKGYLRKYRVCPGGEFYCCSPRLEKSLTYKEASKFVGVRQLAAGSLGEIVEDKASSASARYAFLQLYTNSAKNYLAGDVKQYTSTSTTMTEAFLYRSYDTLDPDYVELFIGAFWTNYDECDEFIGNLKRLLDASEIISRFVIAAETRVCAEVLAREIKKCEYKKLEEVSWFIYSLKDNTYYELEDGKAVEVNEIWPAFVEEHISPEDENSFDEIAIAVEETNPNEEGLEAEVEQGEVLESVVEDKPIVMREKSGIEGMDTVVYKLINAKKMYCAAAYAKAISLKNSAFSEFYDRLAYALNDPMKRCLYSADSVFDLIPNDHTEFADDLVVAIGLRTFFSNQVRYDYNIKPFYNAIKGYDTLREYPALSNVIYKLVEFKDEHKKGIDAYADYRAKSAAQLDEELKRIQREAKQYYDSAITGKKQEKASQRRFLETKKALLDPNGDIGQYIKAIVENDRDIQPLIVDFLQENFIREDNTISEDNIDADMLLNYILVFWDEAGEKMMYRLRADLMSHLRSNIMNVTTKAIQLMIRWCNIVDRINDQTEDAGSLAYKKIRKPLLDDIKEAIDAIDMALSIKNDQEKAGLEVIRIALIEISRCIGGDFEEYERRFFYTPFLLSDDVLLDETYCPDLMVHSSEIEELQPEYRILQHARKALKTPEDRLKEIFADGGDDYGTARLIMQYLSETGSMIDIGNYEKELAASEKYAKETAELQKEQFVGDLELAQSYGQIDNVKSDEDKKEKILQIVNEWYDVAVESGNFGFFKKIMDSYLAEIRREAKSRENDFVEQLNAFKNATIKGLSKEAKDKKIEKIQAALKQQNYTVVEDLLARADQADDDHEDVVEENFLKDFLDDYNDYYKVVAQNGTFATLVSNRTRNKEERGGKRLADNWLPGGGKLHKDKLTMLLAGFGFNVDGASVEEQNPIGKFENFFVRTVAAKDGKRENYTHPIAAFGSGASQDGFRVVCLNGKYDAAGLIDVMKQIGNAKHTMILLDCALDKPERRILARKSKSELGDKLFVVVDRTVMMYMVKNYDETKANRMLMSLITPFGYFQPYVWESSNVMPPEIFMGRKHELESIKSSTGANIVYGGRQLGKSALLKQAKADIDGDENGDRAILVDIKGLNYQEAAKKIGHALFDEGILLEDISTTDWDELSRVVRKRLQSEKDKIPYLLLLLDEADAFIESCETINYRPFDALKEIQNIGVGRFKFVIAGLRNIVRFKREAALGNNSVLTHLEAMTVKPFHSAEARELMEIPLHYLGLEFPKENESLITLILASTNYFPGLIQMYCAKLLSAMRNKDYAGYDEADTPVYEISEDHIKKVLADPEFMEQIREKYIITLKLDEDNYYYLIALIMAYLYHANGYNEGYSAEDIKNAGKALDIAKIARLNDDKLSAFMEELKELNVLRSTDDTHYLFTRFTFFQMMGTSSEVDDKLVEYMED